MLQLENCDLFHMTLLLSDTKQEVVAKLQGKHQNNEILCKLQAITPVACRCVNISKGEADLTVHTQN